MPVGTIVSHNLWISGHTRETWKLDLGTEAEGIPTMREVLLHEAKHRVEDWFPGRLQRNTSFATSCDRLSSFSSTSWIEPMKRCQTGQGKQNDCQNK